MKCKPQTAQIDHTLDATSCVGIFGKIPRAFARAACSGVQQHTVNPLGRLDRPRYKQYQHVAICMENETFVPPREGLFTLT